MATIKLTEVKKVFDWLAAKKLSPTPDNYAEACATVLNIPKPATGIELLTQLLTLKAEAFVSHDWLHAQLDYLHQVMTDSEKEHQSKMDEAQQVVARLIQNKAQFKDDSKTFTENIDKIVATIYAELQEALLTVNTFSGKEPTYKQALHSCESVESAQFLLTSVMSDVQTLKESLYKTNETMLSTKQELAEVSTQLKQALASKCKLQEQASTDPLTGLLNRRGLYQKLLELTNTEHSIFVLDIDNFKKINDTHGHSTGDLVLKELAATLVSSVRQADLVGRFGGEEFVVVCNGLQKKHVPTMVTKLLSAIRDKPHGGLHITVSGGQVSYLAHGIESFDTAFKLADSYLYKAKQNGKNAIYPLV